MSTSCSSSSDSSIAEGRLLARLTCSETSARLARFSACAMHEPSLQLAEHRSSWLPVSDPSCCISGFRDGALDTGKPAARLLVPTVG